MLSSAACASPTATAYFLKPFRPTLLLQALSRFLPINDDTRDLIRRNADLASGIAESAPKTVGRATSASSKQEVGGTLARGKDILDVLRG